MRFEADFGDRFDLFSPTMPFMQSAELPLAPEKGQRTKTVLFLHPDWPAQGESTHYRHVADDDAALCRCASCRGLVLQSAFAASGGSGIRPSINGVPPVYVLPQGETLFHSLAASLTVPNFQPQVADADVALAWWRRRPVVKEKAELQQVDYVGSLIFVPRQVRLYPEPGEGTRCSRCGEAADWVVRTMVYQMGESRPKDAPLWMDPFVPFRMRKEQGKAAAGQDDGGDNNVDEDEAGAEKGRPIALRPQEGRALWRDYGTLFLNSASGSSIRPSVLTQFDEMLTATSTVTSDEILRFRCIGMRTDGKAKIFEWVDQGLDVPLGLLHSVGAAQAVLDGLNFAEAVSTTLHRVWRRSYGADHDQHKALGQRVLALFWGDMAQPFQRSRWIVRGPGPVPGTNAWKPGLMKPYIVERAPSWRVVSSWATTPFRCGSEYRVRRTAAMLCVAEKERGNG